MKVISKYLSITLFTAVFAFATPVFAQCYSGCNPCCSGGDNYYNSYATNSTSHSREGNWYGSLDEGIDENEYYYNNLNRTTTQQYSYVDTTRVINDNGSIGAYGSPENFQYVSAGYYRGNGGDLRVYDRPFDLVGLSNYVRGGVARSYDTTYWSGSAMFPLVALVVVAVLGFGAYRIGKNSAN